MSLLLVALILAFMGVAGWGFQSVMTELDETFTQPTDSISRKFQVDEFIWSSRARPALRRRYIATQACVIPACLGLAMLVWWNEPDHGKRLLAAAAFGCVSLLVAATLVWKVVRRRTS